MTLDNIQLHEHETSNKKEKLSAPKVIKNFSYWSAEVGSFLASSCLPYSFSINLIQLINTYIENNIIRWGSINEEYKHEEDGGSRNDERRTHEENTVVFQ